MILIYQQTWPVSLKYVSNFKHLTPLKSVIKNEIDVAEMIIRWPFTKRPKRNMIRQKHGCHWTWLIAITKKKFLVKPVVRIQYNLVEMITE